MRRKWDKMSAKKMRWEQKGYESKGMRSKMDEKQKG